MDGAQKSAKPRQLILNLDRPPAFDVDDFLVSHSNEDAFGQIDRWPDWPTNTLVMTGPPGSGKSHLAAIWAQRAGARIVDGQEPIDPGKLGECFAILLEDCDRGRRSETDLFHLLNLAKEAEGWVLLTARTNPSQWGLRTADLVSRLRLSPLAQIGRPTADLLRAVMVKLFADRQIKIDQEIVTYAVLHLDQSLEAITNFVQAVDSAALSDGRRITKALASKTIELLQQDRTDV